MKTKILFCVLFLLSSCSASRKMEKHVDESSIASVQSRENYREQIDAALSEYLRTHATIKIRKEKRYEPQPEKNPPAQTQPNQPSRQAEPILVSENTDIEIDFSQDKNTDSEKQSNKECSKDEDSFSKSDKHIDKETDTDIDGPVKTAFGGLLFFLLLMFVYRKINR